MLAEDIIKKLRATQSKKITESMEHVSFSKVVNDQLRKAIKYEE